MRAALASILVGVAACSLLANGDVQKGLGAACGANSECHAGLCERGLCVAVCKADAECPAPSRCTGERCQVPLRVRALWVGVVAGGEGWTLTHHEGLAEAKRRMPFVDWDFRENVFPDAVVGAVDEAVAAGVKVVVTNSISQRDALAPVARAHPDVAFLEAASFFSNGANAGSFAGRSEQAWFVAGKVAAQKATRRLGILGPLVTPEAIRHINAFALGARSVRPEIVIEVAWIGFWFDWQTSKVYEYPGVPERYYREELLARRLADHGCEVIAHLADNQRSVRLLDRLKLPGVWSLTNDNVNAYRELGPSGPGRALPTCLGGMYWNWGPLYARLFDELHRGAWTPRDDLNEPMTTDADTVVGFQLNPEVGIDDSVVRSFVADAAQRGPGAEFEGPYATTGQRDADGDGAPDAEQRVRAGERPSEREVRTMCFFVKGVVEKANPADGTTADVDALVPDAEHPLLARDPAALDPPGAPRGAAFDCRKNQ